MRAKEEENHGRVSRSEKRENERIKIHTEVISYCE
jgi:hypothetical protein